MDIKELREKLIDCNTHYRQGNPIITDIEYDNLVEQLRAVAPNDEFFKSGVVEQSTPRMEPLPVPMYSLEKVKTISEFLGWVNKMVAVGAKDFVITPKYDGISLVSMGTSAWTRGDGVRGQRSDAHFQKMGASVLDGVISWGEAIIPKQVFAETCEGYKNARNMVAGLFNSPDGCTSPHIASVRFVRYGVEGGADVWASKQEQLNMLGATFSDVTDFKVVNADSFCNATPEALEEYFNRLYNELGVIYKIDGLVIEVNDMGVRDRLGRFPNNNPAYAIAYKRPEWTSVYVATVTGVEVNVSKDGRLSPVILIEPVEMDGATVTRCTGYNMKYIFNNHISRGAKIEIMRSGDVIPKHLKTLLYDVQEDDKMRQELMICPFCGCTAKWDTNGVHLIDSNPNCRGRIISQMCYFFATIGCEGFDEPTIAKLYDAGYRDIDGVIDAGQECLEGVVGQAKAATIISQFEACSKMSFAKYLTALNLFGGKIAEKTVQLILNSTFTDDEEFLDWLGYNDIDLDCLAFEKMCGVKGVGEKTAEAFIEGIVDYREITPSHNITITHIIEQPTVSSAEGLIICFTGFRDKELEAKVVAAGHTICDSVTKNCDVLVAADVNSNSSKMVKAKERGVTIISREEFVELFEGDKSSDNPIKVFTAFSGYDSQCLALKYLGIDYNLVGWSDIDKQAILAHDVLFPEYKDRNYGDISKIDWAQVPDFELFTYSFPCQDISTAGKQAGLEEESGTRSSLLWECRRAIEIKRPKYLLLENVKNLVGKQHKPHLMKWLSFLEGLGYKNFLKVLNAKDYGVPQNRERVFVVSILGGGGYEFPEPKKLTINLSDILEPQVDESYYLAQDRVDKFISELPPKNLEKLRLLVENGQKGVPINTSVDGNVFALRAKGSDVTAIVGGAYPRATAFLEIVGNMVDGNDVGKTPHAHNRVYSPGGIAPTQLACTGSGITKIAIPYDDYNSRIPNDTNIIGTITPNCGNSALRNGHKIISTDVGYRIRKLTPTECLRLMGVREKEIEMLKNSELSKSALYKLAGNSIVVDVLMGIFKQMFNPKN